MHRTYFGLAWLVAGALLFVSATSVDAAAGDQVKNGKNAPEVPKTSALPVVAALGGVTFYVLSRGMRRKAAVVTAEVGAE